MRPSERRTKKVKKKTPGGRVSHRAGPKLVKARACGFCGKPIGGNRVNRPNDHLCTSCSRKLIGRRVMKHDN